MDNIVSKLEILSSEVQKNNNKIKSIPKQNILLQKIILLIATYVDQ